MKKIITLITLSILIYSCTSSEDSQTIEIDPIIGTWQNIKTVYYLTDGTIFEKFADNCDSISYSNVLDDGNIENTSYLTNTNGECELEVIDYEFLKWRKLPNGNYFFNEKIKGYDQFDIEIPIIFYDNNKKYEIYENQDGFINSKTFSKYESHSVKVP